MNRRFRVVLLIAVSLIFLGSQSTTTLAAKPVSPLGLIVRSGDKVNKLTWIASLPKPAGYNIYRATSKGGQYNKINPVETAVTNFTDSNYPAPGVYFYRITAVAKDGTESEPTQAVAPLVVDILASVKAESGANIQSSIGDFELEIPFESLKRDTTIRIQELLNKPKGPENRVLISPVFDCTPGGLKFAENNPAKMRIKYSLPQGFNKESIAVMAFADGSWTELKTKVITQRSMAEVRVRHFTYFAVTARGSKADIERPLIRGATAESSKTITVSYSEPIDSKSAVELTNYRITSEPKLSFVAAAVSKDKRSVFLTTTYQTPGQSYQVRVTGVKDETGNVIEDNGNTNIATFFGGPSPHGEFANRSYFCAACHRAHTGIAPKGLTEIDISALCYSCHDSSGLGSSKRVQADFAKISTHRLSPNKPCTACHNPHLLARTTPKLLAIKDSTGISINSGNEFCFVCHGKTPVPDAPLGDHQTFFAGTSHDTLLPEPANGTRIRCAHCHNAHGSDFPFLARLFEEDLCLACHRNKGATPESNLPVNAPDLQTVYLGGPNNEPAQRTFYKHPSATVSGKHSNAESASNGQSYAQMSPADRHAECTDCHNTHASTKGITGPPFAGPPLRGVSGVGVKNGAAGTRPEYTFKSSLADQAKIEFEYEVCFKCHSSFNKSLPDAGKDKAIEFNPNNASYHPVESVGKNKTAIMDKSLEAANLTSGSQVFCSSCHASDTGLRGPHGSRNKHILKAAYRETLKPRSAVNDYRADEFGLCLTCHNGAAFADGSRSSRNDSAFRLHGFHLNQLYGDPGANQINASDDISTRDAGRGNAICRECHFNIHGVTTTARLVKFAPNVNGFKGQGEPSFSPIGDSGGRCRLRCHGQDHDNMSY